MTPKTPVVVNISLMGPEWDHDTRVTFLGKRFRIALCRHSSDMLQSKASTLSSKALTALLASRVWFAAVQPLTHRKARGWASPERARSRRRTLRLQAGCVLERSV